MVLGQDTRARVIITYMNNSMKYVNLSCFLVLNGLDEEQEGLNFEFWSGSGTR